MKKSQKEACQNNKTSCHVVLRCILVFGITQGIKLFQSFCFSTEGCWSEEEIGRLDASVRASTGTEFGSQIYGDINWVEVADFVMTRTSYQCRAKW
jgi:hypothetical protein